MGAKHSILPTPGSSASPAAAESSASARAGDLRLSGEWSSPEQSAASLLAAARARVSDGYYDGADTLPWDVAAYVDAASSPPPQVAAPGERVNWRCGELLGVGATSRVYRALNNKDGKFMAAKQIAVGALSAALGSDAGVLAGIEREVSIASRLKHPNIASYYCAQREIIDGQDYLVVFQEYMSGGSLTSCLQKFGALDESLARLYTKQVLTGVAYLHAHDVCHRDIKGSNILLDAHGVAKLADFGASRDLGDVLDRRAPASLRGTPVFMAPEVIRQAGYGRKSDIWSVGCTVIEMLTGRPPFADYENPVAAMFAIATGDAQPPLPPGLSPAAADFLRRCFERDPAARPTAAQLLRHPWLADTPTGAPVSAASLAVLADGSRSAATSPRPDGSSPRRTRGSKAAIGSAAAGSDVAMSSGGSSAGAELQFSSRSANKASPPPASPTVATDTGGRGVLGGGSNLIADATASGVSANAALMTPLPARVVAVAAVTPYEARPELQLEPREGRARMETTPEQGGPAVRSRASSLRPSLSSPIPGAAALQQQLQQQQSPPGHTIATAAAAAGAAGGAGGGGHIATVPPSSMSPALDSYSPPTVAHRSSFAGSPAPATASHVIVTQSFDGGDCGALSPPHAAAAVVLRKRSSAGTVASSSSPSSPVQPLHHHHLHLGHAHAGHLGSVAASPHSPSSLLRSATEVSKQRESPPATSHLTRSATASQTVGSTAALLTRRNAAVVGGGGAADVLQPLPSPLRLGQRMPSAGGGSKSTDRSTASEAGSLSPLPAAPAASLTVAAPPPSPLTRGTTLPPSDEPPAALQHQQRRPVHGLRIDTAKPVLGGPATASGAAVYTLPTRAAADAQRLKSEDKMIASTASSSSSSNVSSMPAARAAASRHGGGTVAAPPNAGSDMSPADTAAGTRFWSGAGGSGHADGGGGGALATSPAAARHRASGSALRSSRHRGAAVPDDDAYGAVTGVVTGSDDDDDGDDGGGSGLYDGDVEEAVAGVLADYEDGDAFSAVGSRSSSVPALTPPSSRDDALIRSRGVSMSSLFVAQAAAAAAMGGPVSPSLAQQVGGGARLLRTSTDSHPSAAVASALSAASTGGSNRSTLPSGSDRRLAPSVGGASTRRAASSVESDAAFAQQLQQGERRSSGGGGDVGGAASVMSPHRRGGGGAPREAFPRGGISGADGDDSGSGRATLRGAASRLNASSSLAAAAVATAPVAHVDDDADGDRPPWRSVGHLRVSSPTDGSAGSAAATGRHRDRSRSEHLAQ